VRAALITPVLPAATGNGLSMRAGMWLEALARRFDTDTIAAPLFPEAMGAREFTVSRSRSTTMLSGRLGDDPAWPRTVPVLDEPSQVVLRERLMAADVVVVFRLYLAGLAADAAEAGIPVVVDLDDLDWVREERLGHLAEADAYRRLAVARLGIASVTTTASPADSVIGAPATGESRWMHVPNGVPPASTSTEDHGTADVDLLFVATLGYEPNAQAAAWLVHEVLPRLPGAKVGLVGAAPSAEVRALAGPDVIVAADVPDVSSWYRRGRVCVVPIRAGSGTRTKIPEAWAHRRPVVSTTVGAEGLEVGEAALLADDPDQFARACARLLGDADLTTALVAAGWDRYHSAHSLEHAIHRADAAIDTAIRSSGGRAPARRVGT
jgi:glycosyltransferase involved in cell wall biosynthesis